MRIDEITAFDLAFISTEMIEQDLRTAESRIKQLLESKQKAKQTGNEWLLRASKESLSSWSRFRRLLAKELRSRNADKASIHTKENLV